MTDEAIRLGHGSGGLLTQELLQEVFLPHLESPELAQLDDAGLVRLESGLFAFTTDSFTVQPLFFPGGDIGKLAAAGTLNDLAVSGARPLFLSAGFILEEGLSKKTLSRIVESLARAVESSGARVVAGDTKVVEGSAGVFINTAGLGRVLDGVELSSSRIEPGDRIIVSGTVGDHGFAVLLARGNLGITGDFPSDCAVLWPMLEPVYQELGASVKFVRDPTRGGLATVLNEVARPDVDIILDEASVPLLPGVEAAAEMLGLDPLYSACEGRAVLFVAEGSEQKALELLKSHPLGQGAAVVGTVESGSGYVVARTQAGGERILETLAEDQYPRIC